MEITTSNDSTGKSLDHTTFITYIFYIENPFAWIIKSPKKSFVVRANSDRERQEWLTHLDRCIRYARGIYRIHYLNYYFYSIIIKVETIYNKVLLLHLGYRMKKRILACIVIQRSFLLIIVDM
jgi:hypothetical protein